MMKQHLQYTKFNHSVYELNKFWIKRRLVEVFLRFLVLVLSLKKGPVTKSSSVTCHQVSAVSRDMVETSQTSHLFAFLADEDHMGHP